MRATETGICRLCGRIAPLTKEHIPPAGAYKGRPYRVEVLTGDAVFGRGKGRAYQHGFHARVLCESCIRLTGSWYGDEFARWTRWGLALLDALRAGTPTTVRSHEALPLLIAKQIICTMIASSNDGFVDRQPMLREFVLNKDFALSEGDIRLAVYLCPTSTGRSTGVASAINLNVPAAEPHILVEVALAPFGYVLTLAGTPLDSRPLDIAWFSTCAAGEKRVITPDLFPVLPAHEAFPCDFRTKNEIRRDLIMNVLSERDHPSPQAEAMHIMASGAGPAFFESCGEEW